MRRFLLSILGSILLYSALLSLAPSAHAAAINTDPTQPLANKNFTIGYSGKTNNCVVFRILSLATETYVHRSDSDGLSHCSNDKDNYTSFINDRSTSGLYVAGGLAAGQYRIILGSESTSIDIQVLTSTISPSPTAKPLPLNSCSNRPPECPASLYPGCITSATLCAGSAPNHNVCEFYDLNGQRFCASPAGVTPGASPGTCGFKNGTDEVVSNCSAGYSPQVQQNPTDGLRRTCTCWANSLPSPTPFSDLDEEAPTPSPAPKLPACATFGGSVEGGAPFRCVEVDTAFGRLNVDGPRIVQSLFGVMLGLGGVVAFILIVYSGFQLLTSQGNPEKVKLARERLTSAIVGLLFIIFSLVVLQVIGVDILNLPNFGA